MLALGYSVNLLTLLALISIGLVVDDAIRVENVDRHMKPTRRARSSTDRRPADWAGPSSR